jgi:predicted  nucleic acid-binding Zn-ribbon protein
MYELQMVETRLESGTSVLHSIEQRLTSTGGITQAQAELDSLRAKQESVRTRLRKLEADAEDATAKVSKLTATLYGGGIHDSREMASLEIEISHAKNRQSAIEDEEITLMEQLETLESGEAERARMLAELQAKRGDLIPELLAQRTQLSEMVDALTKERETAAGRLGPARLAMYTRLKARYGHAVSLVEGGMCHWCRVQIPSSDVQHARGDTLTNCPNCGRILFTE